VIKLAPPEAFLVLTAVAVSIGAWELYRMLANGGARPFAGLGLVAIWALLWTYADRPPRFPGLLPLLVATLLVLLLAMIARSKPREMLEAVIGTLFPVLLLGLTLGYLISLRGMPGEDGEDLLMLLFLCVITGDTAAYYVGSSIGKRRLAPRLSPNKTWEGAIAGLVGAVAAGLIACFWFYRRLPPGHAVALGLVIGAAAIVGDLSESMIKRATGVKDASRLLPGHGGMLDRLDSLLFAAPVLYYYYRIFLQGMP
jgi:phosphatidate cytidylyltransferase